MKMNENNERMKIRRAKVKNLLISIHVDTFRRIRIIHFPRHIFLEIWKKKSAVASRFRIFGLVSVNVVVKSVVISSGVRNAERAIAYSISVADLLGVMDGSMFNEVLMSSFNIESILLSIGMVWLWRAFISSFEKNASHLSVDSTSSGLMNTKSPLHWGLAMSGSPGWFMQGFSCLRLETDVLHGSSPEIPEHTWTLNKKIFYASTYFIKTVNSYLHSGTRSSLNC